MNSLPFALYAEDDANTAQLFLGVLAKHNPALRLVQVKNGYEALEFLRRRGPFDGRDPQHPAVIFLDLEMPRADGLETLAEIKADEELRTIPVVILAGAHEMEKVSRSYALGANAHVVKPANFEQFSQLTRTLGDFWLTMNQVPAPSVAHS